ncbi:hypothetical protein M3172_08990 [Mesobacillus subterraneus]|uniref:hypothetical protein n=1 Tax=Mesobacillus subterraneus TaxID=285983 RepID=UPI00203E76E0|nr:hypothetical protein [Mesobacillus subterraneus]MCM3573330.1 hypothetical protein [Mesobacillus subterraneus]
MVKVDELDINPALEKVREELDPLYVKHEYLHEMIREFYANKDFESETVRYLDKKLDELNARMDTLRKVRDYLENLVRGIPFYVNRRVGRYMARFGLAEKQAQLLVDVYKEHWKTICEEDKSKYLLGGVHKVDWVEEEKCLHVHFGDTWWRYSVDGSWY